MKKIYRNILVLFSLVLLQMGCTIKYNVLNVHYKDIKLSDSLGVYTQSKDGLTVKMETLSFKEMYKHPELFSFNPDLLTNDYYKSIGSNFVINKRNNNRWYYIFNPAFGNDFVVAVKVSITNKTDHILRMGDSRMFLRIEGEDAIPAFKEIGNSAPFCVNPNDIPLIQQYLPLDYANSKTLVGWLTSLEAKTIIEQKLGDYSSKARRGFASQVLNQNRKNYKLISGVDVEILPNDTFEGLLVFPAVVSDSKMKIILYDLHTKVDKAGNVLEKTNFEFHLLSKGGRMYLDMNEGEFIEGSPLGQKMLYDKVQKRWIYTD